MVSKNISGLIFLLHGVVVLENGKKINLNIGENESDPVFVISDLLPHLSHKIQGDKKIN